MRRSRILALAAAALIALTASACSSPGGSSEGSGSAEGGSAKGAFPVTIEHAFGKTTIEKQPKRVASVAWMNHEVPLALGVVPVGMSKATWGDDNGDGVLPWVDDRLKQLGAKTPTLFDETDGIDFEAVAATKPDVILASYSGLTKEEYETLSKIAPVVAEPGVPWGTSLQDVIRMNSEAIGKKAEGDALITELDQKTDAALAKHPKLKEAKALFAYIDPKDFSKIGFYTTHDTRPGFLKDLGMPVPKVVEEETKKTDQFYVTVSAEAADRFSDVDLVIVYGDTKGELVKRLQADPLLSKIPAIKAGRIAVLPDQTPLAASANPSPLSIGWGIDRYFDTLAAPLEK
ncbi:ABC transporter substrate-binding protein [Leucobacter sp. OLJS4]|uniref:iron-siderophore ABC transporter substrate-binding protein n=1 Tax=unclassified Leucobacter TaxID=2621730 RepID=UPI000C18BE40|nr:MULTISPECIES: iron-siderophore ABC transporter substrate-binding protein [unclassified Leucobacter]PII84799.1 ABC transporter substrate-binding protein [Leucobacter sp. OLCALW19]PII87774.1 ABC transporter substrate-binding protein [Leucobacter sp. OLTLW20]PII93862.1 ABC transporter substrate-binding protein [Leucobacter sp. OLAS13]PII98469.1 ABC transporter substrate-binding protein [Leucobacter sp. OLDS2]PIJ00450.1 ABC transporter substrate-binding protein [Leucobacter sp. OLCS4]